MNNHNACSNNLVKATASASLAICDTFSINRSAWLFRQKSGEAGSIHSLSNVTHHNTEAEGVES